MVRCLAYGSAHWLAEEGCANKLYIKLGLGIRRIVFMMLWNKKHVLFSCQEENIYSWIYQIRPLDIHGCAWSVSDCIRSEPFFVCACSHVLHFLPHLHVIGGDEEEERKMDHVREPTYPLNIWCQ